MERQQSKHRQKLRSSQRRALSFAANPSVNPPEAGNVLASHSLRAELKVAIPRLHRPGLKPSLSAHDRQRVSHACEPCRQKKVLSPRLPISSQGIRSVYGWSDAFILTTQKAKCDGSQPACSRCRDHEIHCFYADNKREKLKRQVALLLPYALFIIDPFPILSSISPFFHIS